MPEFDRDKLCELTAELGMDEAYFARNLKHMIDGKGLNMAQGMKMLGDLKGLGRRDVKPTENNLLSELGMAKLTLSVQDNRRLGKIETAEIVE